MTISNNDELSKEDSDKQLWLEFKANPTREQRDLLLSKYDYIPRTIAYQFSRKKPRVLDVEDLIQSGRMGLMQALDRYEPSKKVKFNTYATIRVRGAILDTINKVDWTPRPIRENIKKVIRAIEKSGTGLSVSDDEDYDVNKLSEIIGDMTPQQVKMTLLQMRKTYVAHMDKDTMNSLELDIISGRQRDYSMLHVTLSTVLTEQEKAIIDLKFFGGYKDYEIIKMLSISQHQLNRAEQRALEKLSHNIPDEFM